MRKTFTLLLLLFTAIFISPQLSRASVFELSSTDTRFGDKEVIKLYPNPMTSEANIKISEEVDLQFSKVSVVFYNIVGSEVFKISQVKDYEQKITRDIFKSSGIYFFQLKVDEKVISTGRITVK
ncbi:MAG: T9SS type A sorting domain-containing protein [Sphingobacteriales bacterium]|nr:T9SS type A sorting domain-containing protein [Sphingobacteriales bacterium]